MAKSPTHIPEFDPNLWGLSEDRKRLVPKETDEERLAALRATAENARQRAGGIPRYRKN